MVMWKFWLAFISVAVNLLSLCFIWVNWVAIRFYFELWRGRKKIFLFKIGNVITDIKLLSKEPEYGVELGQKTYTADEKKGLRLKRMPVHVFEESNTIELDFSDKKGLYAPEKLDPAVYQKLILRAKAAGVNDDKGNTILYILIATIAAAILSGLALYFGYSNYEMIRDQVVGAIIKV